MKLAQNKVRWLARLMLALVLFAQGVVAANACILSAANPSQAFAADQDDSTMPCHEEETSNANACLTHCTQSDQISLDQHEAPLAVPATVVLRISEPPEAQPIHPVAFFEHLALDTGPPIPIRFCSFLN